VDQWTTAGVPVSLCRRYGSDTIWRSVLG